MDFQKIDPTIRKKVTSEFIARNYLGNEAPLDGALTFDDYCLIRRFLK